MRGMVATPRIFCSGYQHRVKVSSSQVNGHCVDPDRNSFCRVWLKGFKQSLFEASCGCVSKNCLHVLWPTVSSKFTS